MLTDFITIGYRYYINYESLGDSTWEREEYEVKTQESNKKYKNHDTVWKLPLHKKFLTLAESLIEINKDIEYWYRLFQIFKNTGFQIVYYTNYRYA